MNENWWKADLVAVLFTGLFVLILLFVCVFDAKMQEACTFVSSNRFVLLGDVDLGIEGVSVETFGSIDTFMRQIYRDDGLDHVLAIVPSYGLETHAAVTLLRYKWDWGLCEWTHESRIRIDLTQAIILEDGAAMFGAIVHELAHANGRQYHEGNSDDAVWWERIALKAYYGRCGNLEGVQEQRCDAVREMIE